MPRSSVGLKVSSVPAARDGALHNQTRLPGAVLGQRNLQFSRRLIRRLTPVPSQNSSFILSTRSERNT